MKRGLRIFSLLFMVVLSMGPIVYGILGMGQGGSNWPHNPLTLGLINSPANNSFIWVGNDPSGARPTLDLNFTGLLFAGNGGNFTSNASWVLRGGNGINFTLIRVNDSVSAGTELNNRTNVSNLKRVPIIPQGYYNLTIVLHNHTISNFGADDLHGLNAFVNATIASGNITTNISLGNRFGTQPGGHAIFVYSRLDIKGINITAPETGTNITGIYFFNFSIGRNNMTTNATWYAINDSGGGTQLGLNNSNNGTIFSFNTSTLKDGNYTIVVNATNMSEYTSSRVSIVDTNVNVNVDNTDPIIGHVTVTDGARILTNASDLNGTNFLQDTDIRINVTVTESNVESVYIYYNLTGALATTSSTRLKLSTNSLSSPFTYNITVDNGRFNDTNVTNFIIEVNDTTNHLVTENQGGSGFNFTIDGTLPVVHLVSPANYTTDTDNKVVFTINVTETYLANCSLFGDFNGTFALNQKNASAITSGVNFDFNSLILNANITGYQWNAQCEDLAKNRDFNKTNYTIFEDPTPPGGGGGTSGGSRSPNPFVGYLAPEGLTATIHEGESINFVVNSLSHKLKIISIKSNGMVEITIFSHPISFEIAKDQTKDIDLNHDGKKDVSITLVDITSSRNVKLLIEDFKKKLITEFIEGPLGIDEGSTPQAEVGDQTINEFEEEIFVEPKTNKGIIFGIVILILLVGITYFYFKKEKS